MLETSQQPARFLRDDDYTRFVPVHVVWEITLACDLKCLHCGSRAGRRRPDELNTQECLDVIDSLARLGTREVSLIGGEAYLRKDWIQLIKAIRSHGMYCAIQTGGRNLNPARLAAAVEAGLNGVGVSLDGLAPLHDKVRNVPGAFGRAVDTLKRARAAGLATSVNTQIGAQTMADLPALMDTIIELGATHWQIQLTVAMGNAADNDELLLQPYQLQELMPLLADLYKRGLDHGLLMNVGNNIGYYGPYEHLWRGFGDERVHWTGCSAGQQVIALEADGTVKGCPSLATVGFAGGNVRDLSLEEIWRTSEAIHFGRLRSVDDLWGFCRSCYYADVCRGGCTWTSHSLLGKPGNNPYCHYRVIELQKQGLRERIAKVEEAGPASFAVGRFDLVTERIDDGTPVSSIVRSGQTIELTWKNKGKRAPDMGRLPTKLELCRNCNGYVHAHEHTCPHCNADIAAAAQTYEEQAQYRRTLMTNLEHLLGQPVT
ncbi:GDL motif peptide-associated radical SAM/SPASM maturase [Paraburkholderia sp. D15]|uniref:GDL motif peptide-associated radical SAM/SPASM maturase n=1 Tax=Paraburkholderia sp. D15 TaxID=2880218 RepID=UPI002478D796|nr:GDL motif peptide-associated radical SAM/SPASM maturase [Paraburkholderia sp. D15]WGS54237.1 GDL motif peptide-associated radical SAM/SPASM maturase [Paraburkholderia sp. D15]